MGLLNKEPGEHHVNMADIITYLMSHFPQNEWIIDFGATHHITTNLKLLKDSVNIDTSKRYKVHLPIGEKIEITHTGNAGL